jgi:hypothetical protein
MGARQPGTVFNFVAIALSGEIAWRPDFIGAKSVKELSEQVLA